MKKNLFLACAFAFALIGCAVPRVEVDSSWDEAPNNVTVLVSAPYVDNDSDVEDDFETEEEFHSWLVDYVDGTFTDNSVSTPRVRMVDDIVFEMTDMVLNGKDVRIPVPIPEKLPDVSGVVVSFYPINFWREYHPCVMGLCINNQNLSGSMTYSIVSIKDRRVLAYGMVKDHSSFTFAMTLSNWESMVKSLVRKTLRGTPLEG